MKINIIENKDNERLYYLKLSYELDTNHMEEEKAVEYISSEYGISIPTYIVENGMLISTSFLLLIIINSVHTNERCIVPLKKDDGILYCIEIPSHEYEDKKIKKIADETKIDYLVEPVLSVEIFSTKSID